MQVGWAPDEIHCKHECATRIGMQIQGPETSLNAWCDGKFEPLIFEPQCITWVKIATDDVIDDNGDGIDVDDDVFCGGSSKLLCPDEFKQPQTNPDDV